MMLERPYYCLMRSVCHQERKNRQKRPLHTCQLALRLSQKTLFLMQHCKMKEMLPLSIFLLRECGLGQSYYLYYL